MDLESLGLWPSGFDSRRPHHVELAQGFKTTSVPPTMRSIFAHVSSKTDFTGLCCEITMAD